MAIMIRAFALCVALMEFCGHQVYAQSDETIRQRAKLLGVIPTQMPGSQRDTPAMITLGERLYFETALSVNRSQSCNSCHNLLAGGHGVDHLPQSVGALGQSGRRNAPSTWNAGFQFAQNWDASEKNLADQAVNPILNAKEMAMPSKEEAVARLKSAGYEVAFSHAFPNASPALSFINITRALAAFQRTLITQDRFDQYLRGDNNALTEDEKQGFLLFQQKSCASCHGGPLLGGQFVMKLGLVNPYPNDEDKGFAEVTGRDDHNFLFKVPILRNVGNTAPYFHDGAGKTLEQAVFLTGWHQLGVELSDDEVRKMTAFLRSLNNLRPYKSEKDINN